MILGLKPSTTELSAFSTVNNSELSMPFKNIL